MTNVDKAAAKRAPRSPLVELVLSRWRIFYREPSAMFWTYGFPILLAFALGIAFRNRPPEAAWVGVVREGEPAKIQTTLAQLQKSPELHVELFEPEPAHRALTTGKVVLLVHPGEQFVYEFDPTRPESRLGRALVDEVLQAAAGRVDRVATAQKQVAEPGSRYIDFFIPGMLGFGLMSSGLWGVGYVLVDMRTKKLLRRLVATPMRRSHFLLSFVVMRGLFLVIELPLLLGFAYFTFKVPIVGSLVLLTALATLGSLVFAGLGLLVACRAQNVQTVGGLINFLTLPMSICSGVFFSAERFPASIQPVIRALPLTALIDGLRAIMLEGVGITGLFFPITVLAIWGVVAFGVALKWFRWS